MILNETKIFIIFICFIQAFYLPGSISKDIANANGTTRFTIGEDWNKNTPPLSLWSRTDWIVDHQQIALQHGHLNALGSNRDQQQFNLSYKSKVNVEKNCKVVRILTSMCIYLK